VLRARVSGGPGAIRNTTRVLLPIDTGGAPPSTHRRSIRLETMAGRDQSSLSAPGQGIDTDTQTGILPVQPGVQLAFKDSMIH
jgi:hypothetical protein